VLSISRAGIPEQEPALSSKKYHYALCFKTPRLRYAVYPDGTPMLNDNWERINLKGSERDYGWAALKKAWKRVYKLLWDADLKVEMRCYARETGWEPKYTDSYQQWKENGFKNRKRFYHRAKGKGRWHLHALLTSVHELDYFTDILPLIRKMQKILLTKNHYNVDFAKVRNLAAYKKYIEKNNRETVRPGYLKHARLIEQSHNFEELFLPQKSSETVDNTASAAIVITSPFKAIIYSYIKIKTKIKILIVIVESNHDPPMPMKKLKKKQGKNYRHGEQK
jgi:hypothetical protein